MIIGLVSDFFSSVNQRDVLDYLNTRLVHLSMFLKFMFADSRTGKF